MLSADVAASLSLPLHSLHSDSNHSPVPWAVLLLRAGLCSSLQILDNMDRTEVAVQRSSRMVRQSQNCRNRRYLAEVHWHLGATTVVPELCLAFGGRLRHITAANSNFDHPICTCSIQLCVFALMYGIQKKRKQEQKQMVLI